MKKSTKIIIGVVVVIVVIGIYLIATYNGFVTKREAVDSQWHQVESQLQRRFDLIPNLVSAVKGLTKQEQTVFGQIADARSKYAGASTQSDKVVAAGQFESALSRLLVITENYPDLKSSTAFTALMVELEGTENRISVERQNYNNLVQTYNTDYQKFPGGFFARVFGFSEEPYFQVSDSAQQNPQVDFTN